MLCIIRGQIPDIEYPEKELFAHSVRALRNVTMVTIGCGKFEFHSRMCLLIVIPF